MINVKWSNGTKYKRSNIYDNKLTMKFSKLNDSVISTNFQSQSTNNPFFSKNIYVNDIKDECLYLRPKNSNISSYNEKNLNEIEI